MMHLNAFLMGSGHHESAWRLSRADPTGVLSLSHWVREAQLAEAAKMDSIFIADGLWTGHSVRRTPSPAIEPLAILAALAAVTERIGLIATISTTFNDPFNVARRLASLDHLSEGRAAWNVVTSATDAEARNFGAAELIAHTDRYARAAEFIDVACKLWDSWEDGACVADQSAGVWGDTDRIHEIGHDGEHFRVHGPLTTPRGPQGHPVMFQAGSSEAGRELAARYADAIFTAAQRLEQAQAFYADVKARVAQHGRPPSSLKILPGLSPIVASTEAEARALARELDEVVAPQWVIDFLSQTLEYDFTEADLDRPLPPDLPAEVNGHVGRSQLLIEQARREGLTLRGLGQKVAFARGHVVVVGAPEQVADTMETWFREGAADGFNIMPPALPSGLEAFAEHVVPVLQARGLFRRDYEGATLRDHLGLERPAVAPLVAETPPGAVAS